MDFYEAADKEAQAIEQALESGQITETEYREEMGSLSRDMQEQERWFM